MNIQEVVALVTGGASGLGEACVLELVKKGARAAIIDVDVEKGEKLAANIGANAIFVKTDITSEADVRQAIQKAVDVFGKINAAINCAGVVNVTRLAVEQMMNNAPGEEGEKGVIINSASIAAFEGQIGQAAYSASKAGIVGMTLPIAREISDYGMRIVTIAPGIFDTPMMAGLPPEVKEGMAKTVPFPRRLGNPAEFAQMALHIIENKMLNGCCIRLDGALRMSAK